MDSECNRQDEREAAPGPRGKRGGGLRISVGQLLLLHRHDVIALLALPSPVIPSFFFFFSSIFLTTLVIGTFSFVCGSLDRPLIGYRQCYIRFIMSSFHVDGQIIEFRLVFDRTILQGHPGSRFSLALMPEGTR